MIKNHDAVHTSPHPTTFANIRGMLLQHPPREGVVREREMPLSWRADRAVTGFCEADF
jgi:hypothetical protein